MTVRGQRAALVGAAILTIAGAVALTTFAVPPAARPAIAAIGAIGGIVLVLHLFTSAPTEINVILAIAGVAMASVAIGAEVALLVAAPVLLLAFGEIAALRSMVMRVEREAPVDQQGRLAESATMITVASVAAAAAAVGSILRVSGQIVVVMLGALAIAALGKIITERARA